MASSMLTLPSLIFQKPALSILLPVVLGSAVGYATRPNETKKTYKAIKQPPLRPPPWLFGPVWMILYATMGYAAFRAYMTGQTSIDPKVQAIAKHGSTLYTMQLCLNLIWMPLFFGLGRPIASAIDIVALTGLTSYLTYLWNQIDNVAALLMVPYITWLGFATYLNIGVGYLNDWDISHSKKE